MGDRTNWGCKRIWQLDAAALFDIQLEQAQGTGHFYKSIYLFTVIVSCVGC